MSGIGQPGCRDLYPEVTDQADAYDGRCFLCCASVRFVRNHVSLREGYRCPECGASLRYRGQAEVLTRLLRKSDECCLRHLGERGDLNELDIFEPGFAGPFRKTLRRARRYEQSFFWNDVAPGDSRDGIVCQDLEHLTFDDESFDVVVTSDIMEHVRRPWDAFREIARVLKPGGSHIFSIPVQLPMRKTTEWLVDTTGEEDVYLAPPRYHGDGRGGKSLLYTLFGWDMMHQLLQDGGEVLVHTPSDAHAEAQRLLTFSFRKTSPDQPPPRKRWFAFGR